LLISGSSILRDAGFGAFFGLIQPLVHFFFDVINRSTGTASFELEFFFVLSSRAGKLLLVAVSPLKVSRIRGFLASERGFSNLFTVFPLEVFKRAGVLAMDVFDALFM